MSGAPHRSSSAPAAPFIDTSSSPMAIPMAAVARTSSGSVRAKAGSSIDRAVARTPMRMARRPPRRPATAPVARVEAIEPPAKLRSATPTARSDRDEARLHDGQRRRPGAREDAELQEHREHGGALAPAGGGEG